MLRRFSVNFALFSIVLDAALVAGCLRLAEILRPRLSTLSFAQPLAAGEVEVPQSLYLVFPVTWIAVLLLFNLYDGRRNLRVVNELSSLTLGGLLAAIACAGLLYLSFRDVSRLLFAAFVLLTFTSLVAWRIGWRAVQRWRGWRAAGRRVLVIGAGDVGLQVRSQIEEHTTLGL